MLSKRPHFAGTDHVTPERGSKGWKRVIARGCGGDTYYGQDGADFYCRHEYSWSCDDCPIGIESMDREQEKWEAELRPLQGPPRKTGKSSWLTPEVDSELFWYKEDCV